jgi:hypothetical protein
MAHTLIELYNNLLTYEGNIVYVVFADGTTEPYFHEVVLLLLLNCADVLE